MINVWASINALLLTPSDAWLVLGDSYRYLYRLSMTDIQYSTA